MVQDRAIFTMADQQKVAYGLLKAPFTMTVIDP